MVKSPPPDKGPERPDGTDPAILRLARALARQAAREDHEAERAGHTKDATHTDEEDGRTACAGDKRRLLP